MEIELSLKQNIVNAFQKLGVNLNIDEVVIEHSKDRKDWGRYGYCC